MILSMCIDSRLHRTRLCRYGLFRLGRLRHVLLRWAARCRCGSYPMTAYDDVEQALRLPLEGVNKRRDRSTRSTLSILAAAVPTCPLSTRRWRACIDGR